MLRRFVLGLMLAALPLFALAAGKPAPDAIQWLPWSDAHFERAKREKKFVLLDVEAVWCHWCHVMDAKTYTDPKVKKLIKERYIAVKVNSDAHPEIARRYEDYGWPATIVFDATGQEIVKRRGYMPAPMFSSILEGIIRDPSPIIYADSAPVTRFASEASLAPGVRKELESRYFATHDPKMGGLTQEQKYIDRDTVEYGLFRASSGDTKAGTMARQTLDGALGLIDPVWGGIYQYSTHGDWKHIHFEKIIQSQADAMRLYAMAWARYGDARYKKALEDIHRYVRAFLTSPEGTFYVSQDADLIKGQHSEDYFALNDAQRRARGIPAIDKHVFSRENGWMLQALAAAYMATGETRYLDEARTAAAWIVAQRSLPGGGFRHDVRDSHGPYLEDTLAMGRGLLALYEATGERKLLAQAEAAADFIDKTFRAPKQPGFVTSPFRAKAVLKPKTVLDENIAAVRFGNALARYSGKVQYRRFAEHAMPYVATEQVALFRRTDPGVLQAATELGSDPTHITVVGAKNDRAAATLFRAALANPAVYRRMEWWDTREGAMPNPDVKYPQMDRAAAYLCVNSACSAPIFDVAELARISKEFEKLSQR
ncbi:MAG: DUF255 domain-containing protein [Pseudomonadota bacterium]